MIYHNWVQHIQMLKLFSIHGEYQYQFIMFKTIISFYFSHIDVIFNVRKLIFTRFGNLTNVQIKQINLIKLILS